MLSHEDVARIYKDAKPAQFVHLATLFAAMADKLGESLEWVIGRGSSGVVLEPTPPLDTWLSLYSHHRRIFEAVMHSQFGRSEGTAPEFKELASLLNGKSPDAQSAIFEKMSPSLQEQLLSVMRPVPFPPDESTIRAMLGLRDLDLSVQVQGGEANRFAATVEGQFFTRVWFPCWAIYQTYPPVLMRRAKRGCDDALEKLIRLDKSAMNEPRITRHLHDIRYGKDLERRERMERAIAGSPSERLDAKRIRYLISGLISQFAALAGLSVTAPDIETLFNRIHEVRHGKLQDEFMTSGETLAKAIQRNRNWPSLPKS